MNKKRYIFLALILLTLCQGMTAKNKTVQKVYMYGFSASFQDSVVYFTDIQELENVPVAERTDFLYGRDSYSNQLRDYFTGKNQPFRTCVVSYAFDRKHIEKKYLKMKSKYTKKGNFDVRYLKTDEFKFNKVEPAQVVEQDVPETPKAAKKGKKKKKDRS